MSLIAFRPPKAIGKGLRCQKRARHPRVMQNRLAEPSKHQQTTNTTKRITLDITIRCATKC
eukprot:5992047-Heterocapsa_arctica.AAC.1